MYYVKKLYDTFNANFVLLKCSSINCALKTYKIITSQATLNLPTLFFDRGKAVSVHILWKRFCIPEEYERSPTYTHR